MARGEHIWVTRPLGYTHHGIHVGNGRVIHYSGLSRGWRGGPVEEVSLEEFARGRSIRVRAHRGARFDRVAVIARARSRLGEDSYRPLSNNCEHLCEWCIYGEHRSRQVDLLRSGLLRLVCRTRRLVSAPLRLRRSFPKTTPSWPSSLTCSRQPQRAHESTEFWQLEEPHPIVANP